jgi:hypothetical protein
MTGTSELRDITKMERIGAFLFRPISEKKTRFELSPWLGFRRALAHTRPRIR